jgi:hypothetical protein
MLRLILVTLLLPALPAAAESWGTYSYEEGNGAGICPVDIVEVNRYWCFMISCAPEGGPLYMRVAFSDEDVPEAAPVLTIIVDDEDPVRRALRPLATAQIHDYGIEIVPDRDAALIESLSAGSKAQLTLGKRDPSYSYEISLTGSRKAIDSLGELCSP